MKKKVIIILAVILAVVAIGVIGFFAMSDLRQGVIIRKEADAISKLDITKNDIDMNIKTKGDYAVVEKTMKEYMNEYSNNCKAVVKVIEDETIAKILTAENYKNDGPEFTTSKEYIAKTRAEFNEKMNALIDMTSEEKMKEAIQNKNLSEEFVNLYNELMLGDEIKVDLQQTVEALQQSSKSINNVFDVQEKVIDLLIANKGKWDVNNNGEIEFQTQKLVNEYNNLIGNL